MSSIEKEEIESGLDTISPGFESPETEEDAQITKPFRKRSALLLASFEILLLAATVTITLAIF